MYFSSRRFMSRVVPWRELTMACCFLPSELKREDFPTLGRPIREIFRGDFSAEGFWRERFRVEAMADFRFKMLWPVVARMRCF